MQKPLKLFKSSASAFTRFEFGSELASMLRLRDSIVIAIIFGRARWCYKNRRFEAWWPLSTNEHNQAQGTNPVLKSRSVTSSHYTHHSLYGM